MSDTESHVGAFQVRALMQAMFDAEIDGGCGHCTGQAIAAIVRTFPWSVEIANEVCKKNGFEVSMWDEHITKP